MALLNKFYGTNELNQDFPQKAVKFLVKLKMIEATEPINAVVGKTMMGTIYEALAITNRQIAYFSKDLGKSNGRASHALNSITGASLESEGKFGTLRLKLIIGGSEKVTVPFDMQKDDLDKLYMFVQDIIRKDSKSVQEGISCADEIMKFKSLLDGGVITQEEFDAKKKQLLGL